uniref:Cathepsin L n=1 Tax=Euprymna scolopes TaxID=6613 RepID=A0A3G1QAE2_EUPSC|nr:cathepsin L [Euprymna scolopes]
MKVFLALLVLLPAAVLSQMLDSRLDDRWEEFKLKYNKGYDRPGTELKRRVIWERNFHHVIYHNREADKGLKTFWLDINEYADMHGSEFVAMMNGMMSRNMTRNTPTLIFDETDVSDLPTEVDWRKKGYVTEIKNQAQCGSCWAFSTTGSLEGQHFKKTQKLISLSEQQLVDCSHDCGNQGCNGGLMDNAFDCIKKHGGIMSEADYPYKGVGGSCHFDKSKVVATVTGHVDVKSGSEEALQKAVGTVGPVSVAIDASHFSFQLYSHGIYKIDNCSPTRLDHGVLAVGYGSESGNDYWLVKNSWGQQWGMDGYIKMARNYENMCGIATSASYPLV